MKPHEAWRSTKPREACGVVAVAAQDQEPARLAFFALYALQHRGQESAGICTANGHSLNNLTGMGLVSQVFHERDLAKLRGDLAIGHTRYSTTGSSRAGNAQPLVVESPLGGLALAHNGNLVNVEAIRSEVLAQGVRPRTSTDSELIAHLIARPSGPVIWAAIRRSVPAPQPRSSTTAPGSMAPSVQWLATPAKLSTVASGTRDSSGSG